MAVPRQAQRAGLDGVRGCGRQDGMAAEGFDDRLFTRVFGVVGLKRALVAPQKDDAAADIRQGA